MPGLATRVSAGVALTFCLCLLLSGPAGAQDVQLNRMDLDGFVENVDTLAPPLGFDINNIRNNAHTFAAVLFPFTTPFDIFPSFGGNVAEYYFELPAGVTSIRAITIFDDHTVSPFTCNVGSASFGINTGPDIVGVTANDGVSDIYASAVARFIPGAVVPADPLLPFNIANGIVELTDSVYGDDMLASWPGTCAAYPHLRGTNMGPIPNLTGGLAGVPSMVLGLPEPFAVYGSLQPSVNVPCDAVSTGVLTVGPVYGDPAPPGKRTFPGVQAIGCGGRLTLELSTDAVAVAGNGPNGAGADIIIFESGFAEDPVAAVGSSTAVGPINTDNNGGPVLNCAVDPLVDPLGRGQANIMITNDTEPFYQSGGFPPFGFEFEMYKIKVVDGSGFYPDQIQEFTAGGDIIEPTPGFNTKTLGPYDVTCQSVFYLYLFGDDDGFGNGDADGTPEQIFASNFDLAGVSFQGWTGITPEPTVYDPTTLLEAGAPVQVLGGGGGAAAWTLYSFGTGLAIGSASVASSVALDIDPDSTLPDTLYVGSESLGRLATMFLEPGGDLLPEDLDPASVQAEGGDPSMSVSADASWSIADGNGNGISDLTVFFDRRDLAVILPSGEDVLITVRGTTFSGSNWAAQARIDVLHLGVDFSPNTLNVDSNGKWVTLYIEHEELSASDLDPATVKILSSKGDTEEAPADMSAAHGVGDGNNNGIEDLMVKVDHDLMSLVLPVGDSVPVLVEGLTIGGDPWSIEGRVRVIEKKK